MNNAEKKYLDSIKKKMKEHGLTSYDINVFEVFIGKKKVVPKGWQILLVPIKGYYYDRYELPQIMLLNGELYFIVEKQYKNYDFRYKKEFFRFTWDELVNFVETTPLSTKAYGYGGKGNTDWGKYLLRNIESSLSCYDAHEELKIKFSDRQIDILVERIESEKNLAEKLIDKMLGY